MAPDEREQDPKDKSKGNLDFPDDANFATAAHSDYEFTLTFSRVDHEVEADEVPGVVVTRVSLAPQAMRELIDAMQENWSRWQTREGIKRLPETGDF